MSAPLSTTGGRRGDSESKAWDELEDVFAGLGQLARSAVAPQKFYRSVLEETVRALPAVGGAVWLPAPGGALQPAVQINWSIAVSHDDVSRRDYEVLLTNAARRGQIMRCPPRAAADDERAANPTDYLLMLASVTGRLGSDDRPVLAIVELLLRPDASPAAYRGCEQFLTAICELAADFHAFCELQALREQDQHRSAMLRLSGLAHGQLNLSDTVYTVANEGRRVIGCDRLSIVAARGRAAKLVAASGVSRIECRSGAVRRLEELAELVRRTEEPAYYADGYCDALPPVAEALEQHAEESHARQVAAVPLSRPALTPDEAASALEREPMRRHELPQFVLVAEQFDARNGDLSRDRLVEVAEVCSTALYNALDYDRLPLVWLLRPAGRLKHSIASHLSRTAIVCLSVTAAIAALVLVPAEFRVEAPGALQPVVRREVFAPRSGLVDEVLVAHGANVAAGQPLVRLRDPALDLELKRVDGELETAQRQIDAVRTTRTNRSVRDVSPTDSYRLSADQREIEQRLTNLRNELELLQRDREQLVVISPIAGRVLSWDIGQQLIARPVERGEVLVAVADLSAEWQLELDIPDDRIGYVLAAQQELRPDLPVRFRLSSDDRQQHTGHIIEVAQMASLAADDGTAASPAVHVKVALDEAALGEASRRELQPGVSARAQIACGRRSLGYVWFHDLWDAAREWLWF